jgi:uncharacterized ubiquitin-like protein YukD
MQGKQGDMPSINVTVYDSTENKRVPVELPDDAPVNKIIAVLIDKLSLPKNGPDGAPLSYKFHHKNSGRQIQDSQTLAASGVHEGDILRLQPEITAGSGRLAACGENRGQTHFLLIRHWRSGVDSSDPGFCHAQPGR